MSRLQIVVATVLALACGPDTPESLTALAAASVSAVAIADEPPPVAPGETRQLRAVARLTDGSEHDVTAQATWSSTQPEVASVARGLVTGRAIGRVQIIATYAFRSGSIAMLIEPDGTFVLSGTVTEPGPRPVTNATVVVTGSAVRQTSTSTRGTFEIIGVSGAVTLKASKEGYLDGARTLTVTDDRQVNIEITPIASQVDITGTYTLTLTVSPACAAVPEQYRIRTYTANIRQTRTNVSVVLTDAKFKPDVEGSDNDGFGGIAFGTTVSFTVGTPGFDGDQIEEILPEGHILGFSGKMVTEGGRTMAGDFPGEFTFTQDNTVRSCSTTDSRLAFTWR